MGSARKLRKSLMIDRSCNDESFRKPWIQKYKSIFKAEDRIVEFREYRASLLGIIKISDSSCNVRPVNSQLFLIDNYNFLLILKKKKKK